MSNLLNPSCTGLLLTQESAILGYLFTMFGSAHADWQTVFCVFLLTKYSEDSIENMYVGVAYWEMDIEYND